MPPNVTVSLTVFILVENPIMSKLLFEPLYISIISCVMEDDPQTLVAFKFHFEVDPRQKLRRVSTRKGQLTIVSPPIDGPERIK